MEINPMKTTTPVSAIGDSIIIGTATLLTVGVVIYCRRHKKKLLEENKRLKARLKKAKKAAKKARRKE